MVIAAVGAVALIATVTGVVLYDEVAAETPPSYGTFEDTDALVKSKTGQTAGEVLFDDIVVPDNSTSANVMVTVTFSGTPAQGSNIQISGYWTDPMGVDHEFDDQTLVVPQRNPAGGNPTPSVTFELDASWATPLMDGDEPQTMSWDNIQVVMNIGGDSEGAAGGLPIPGVQPSYTYNVDVSGTISGYEQVANIPDTTAGP